MTTFQQFTNKYNDNDANDNLATEFDETFYTFKDECGPRDAEWDKKFKDFLVDSYKHKDHEEECANELNSQKQNFRKSQNLLEELISKKREQFSN